MNTAWLPRTVSPASRFHRDTAWRAMLWHVVTQTSSARLGLSRTKGCWGSSSTS